MRVLGNRRFRNVWLDIISSSSRHSHLLDTMDIDTVKTVDRQVSTLSTTIKWTSMIAIILLRDNVYFSSRTRALSTFRSMPGRIFLFFGYYIMLPRYIAWISSDAYRRVMHPEYEKILDKYKWDSEQYRQPVDEILKEYIQLLQSKAAR